MPDAPEFHGTHFEFIKTALPDWVKQASLTRLRALKSTGLSGTAPYPQASRQQHLHLQGAVSQQWQSQNALDQAFADLSDVKAFAEPLLKGALQAQYGDIDVRTTFLRTYVNADQAWWTINVKPGVYSRTVSLLDAALHNFAANDQFVDAAFLGPADARGQQDILTLRHQTHGTPLTAVAFKAICRALDIGARYQASLTRRLGFNDPARARALRDQVIGSQQQGLRTAAHLALLKGDIQADAHGLMLSVSQGQANLALDGKTIGCYSLSLMDMALAGIVIFATEQSTAARRLIVYVPQDPEHPLKEYPSPQAFQQELTRQLRATQGYQGFFSQFVAHSERGAFFSQLNAPLRLNLQDIASDYQNRSATPEQDTLWRYRYRIMLNKIVNDARDIAVSTADVDRHDRWAWWDNLEKILGDILNAALLVITPFVPGLGELMLAYSAYQITDQVFEGIVDWAEGRGAEAFEQAIGVAQSALQFALFAGAVKVGGILRPKLSAFVEGLVPVKRADGQARLWHPDLAPYAQTVAPPAGSPPKASGLHPIGDKTLLALDGRHYEVRQEPVTEKHHVVHPTRPDAYRPRVTFNGEGAFVHEGEQPRSWDSSTLMRRLGHRMHGFSDTELEQMRVASATDEGVLRSVYVHNQGTPPLLAGTLARAEAQRYPQIVSRKIRSGQALAQDPSSDWFEQMVTELQGWPQDKAIEVFQKSDFSGVSHTFGHPHAGPADTLRLSLAQVMSGNLPERVLGFLDEPAIHTLLGADVAPPQRVQHLRNQLADYVESQTGDIAQRVYQTWESIREPRLQLLRHATPDLDTSAARAVIGRATEAELAVMDQHQRVPLRLQNLAREVGFAARTVRAFEGFDQVPAPLDTERLVLNTLKTHSDVFTDLHVEIREQRVDGAVHCDVGPPGATHQRILIRGPQGYTLPGPSTTSAVSLYDAVLRALPEPQRDALGYRLGQGAGLKHWLMQTLAPLAERRTLLAEPPVANVAARETLQLLGGPAISRCGREPAMTPATHVREALQQLFPSLNDARLERFLTEFEPGPLRIVLNDLIVEQHQLLADLNAWESAPTGRTKDSREDRREKRRRGQWALVLRRCWEDRFAEHLDGFGQVQSGARLDTHGLQLPETLPRLTTRFEHVTSLAIGDSGMKSNHGALLEWFPSLRSLDLNYNDVEQLPAELGKLRFLKHLSMAHNNLQLRPSDIALLKSLRRMEALNLSNNPLEWAPDISLMPHLRYLDLSETQISDWPAGLLAQPRSERFTLDLRGTRIDTVPDLTPGSERAALIARARINRLRLPAVDRERLASYRLGAGLDPERTYEPQGEMTPWLTDIDASERESHARLWSAVELEHGSQGFFEVIRYLQPPEFFETVADEQRYTANQPQLAQQVWRLLRTVHTDSGLRERLFRLSSFPGLCADGGAQIFNEMGIEVLASEARHQAISGLEREARLVTLARGAARLKLLSKVIREDIAHRLKPVAEGGLGLRLRSQMQDGQPGTVDEVDIYLAYQTSLAERLDLPWLSDHMLYRRTANVSAGRIAQAYTTVEELGEGDGLVNQMLLEPYWEEHLRERYDDQYRDNERVYADKFYALDDQQTAENMPDEQYNRLLNDLGYNEKAWMRKVTRDALVAANGMSSRA